MKADTATAITAADTVWCCPVCQAPLAFQDGQGFCANNHRYDRARQGYYNLLLANQKRSQDPGDTRDMMLRRRAFLDAGHYQPLADHLRAMLRASAQSSTTQATQPLSLLDSGCGEGYYLQQLAQTDVAMRGFGLDISREAIKLAARAYPHHEWVVASSFTLPVQTASIDRVLRVFAPGDDAEVRRVLRTDGELWRVSPGPDHLRQLKSHLYDTVQEHRAPNLPQGFVELATESVSFKLVLNSPEEVQQLLGMTPFTWQSSPEKLEALQQLNGLDVQADFIVQRFGVDQ